MENLDDIFSDSFGLGEILENRKKAEAILSSIEEASSTTIKLQQTILSLIKKEKISLEKYAELSAKVILYNQKFLRKSEETIRKSCVNEKITNDFINTIANLVEEYMNFFENITSADLICVFSKESVN